MISKAMNTSCKLLLASIVLILIIITRDKIFFVASNPVSVCISNGNYTSDSIYINNLNTVLSSLSTNINSSGFYYTSFGLFPDKAYALVLCRADISLDACKNCTETAASDIKAKCANEKQAVNWQEHCMLRYSNEKLYGKLAMDVRSYWWCEQNVTSPDWVRDKLANLLDDLRDEAANGGDVKKMAAGNVSGPDGRRQIFIYAVVQCTPDLSPEDCTTCLLGAGNDTLKGVSIGHRGILLGSCFIWYKVNTKFRINNERRIRAELTKPLYVDVPGLAPSIPMMFSPPAQPEDETVYDVPALGPLTPMTFSPPQPADQGIIPGTLNSLMMFSPQPSPDWIITPVSSLTPAFSPPTPSPDGIVTPVPSPTTFSPPSPSPDDGIAVTPVLSPTTFSPPSPSPDDGIAVTPVLSPTTFSPPSPSPDHWIVTPKPSPVTFSSPPPPPPDRGGVEGNKKTRTPTIVIATVGSIVAFIIIILVIVGCIKFNKRTKHQQPVENIENCTGCIEFSKRKKHQQPVENIENSNEISTVESLQYDFGKIRAATNGFSDENKLGQGGFGAVYKGKLQNGQEIAVKRLSKDSGQGDLEFKNEVLLLAKLHHRNLVRLLGFSIKGKEKLLVYELVENASLDQFIFDPIKKSQLDWDRRRKIIGGIAKGILYLHEDSRLRIIHRDLKASNVLLDGAMNPKIADFGMARLFAHDDQTHGSTSKIAGTYGYIAPEYAMHGKFSTKSDVFSFGVLLLEIVSSQKNTYFLADGSIQDLLSFAWKNWQAGTAANLIDPILKSNSGSIGDILRCIHVGLLCVQENVVERPTMASVVFMLSTSSMTMHVPSRPAFLVHGNHANDQYFDRESDTSSSTMLFGSKNEASNTGISPR